MTDHQQRAEAVLATVEQHVSVRQRQRIMRAALERAATEARADLTARIEALAEEWRYKGEYGWGPWQVGEGPDIEGQILDDAACRLRAVLAIAVATENGPQS